MKVPPPTAGPVHIIVALVSARFPARIHSLSIDQRTSLSAS